MSDSTTPSTTQPLVTDENIADHVISQRLLLSLDEAGAIIGQQGATIEKIKEDNNVTINISDSKPNCSDRVLTSTGKIQDVANSIGDVCRVLASTAVEDSESEEKVSSEVSPYFFLRFRLPKPSVEEMKETPDKLKDIVNIRVLVTRSQCSAIIGKNGDRIKSYINDFGVKMLATNNFLPRSNERLLEIQGFPVAITKVLTAVDTLVAKEVVPPTNPAREYYTPYNRNSSQGAQSTGSANRTRTPIRRTGEEFKKLVNIPETYVGAIVGRSGNRIANLRRATRTSIDIGKRSEEEVASETERVFEIVGSRMIDVERAETMLLKNLETEVKRRAEQVEDAV
ncbi:hypothetical protein TPHA_0M01370 [Tetrapisispora phaffii CBS 4417]|uniref:K Homology domain-containing protein n=1 Tax=Tetrapisispora phaffii (strain ATCC 24235 / CBS 4417 / NBRC 1672 / NRRL Y-8282 / UCD 70-5) TaxID=1071381 RepID=G8C0J7_TETPH|nr:hypothetical protein TPHA_0M01370 [Tetrapisispora phaffii CBS 4417]CCE65712.1 hypothetical protein TPHA_0M01370 [Tetrapisispora phaffii CBS 4417]